MKITNTIKSRINSCFSTVTRHGVLTAVLLIIGTVLTPWGAIYAATSVVNDSVKWHPGHYYTLMSSGKDNPRYLDDVYSELKATPALRGVQIRYFWKELETDEDVYDFTAIDQRLEELSALNRRLIIQVQTKSFDPDWTVVPGYLRTSMYEGGVFPFGSYDSKKTIKGYNIKLWNDNVRNRLTKLMNKLGERYNSHPYFEGVGMIESAFGQPITPLTSTQVDKYYANLLIVQTKMRTAFPNTMTIQEMNYPRTFLKEFTNTFKETGTALGCPDIWIDEPGLNETRDPAGLYTYFPKLSGIITLAPTIEHKNYVSTRKDLTGPQPTVSELLKFGRDTLKANYIFWTRTPGYYPKVLELLNQRTQKSNPSGGLDPTCPSVYTSCN